MKHIYKIVLIICSLSLIVRCESEESSFYLTNSDLIRSWEVVSISPGWYSLWTFREDNTYDWYCKWPDRYDITSSGSFSITQNKLRLTGVVPDNNILDSVIELIVTDDKKQFGFYDSEQNEWIYQIIKSEPDYASSIAFYELESYSEDCLFRPGGTTCLGFSDGYIWLVYGSIRGPGENYVSEGRYVEVVLGWEGSSDYRVEYHHIVNTNLVKKVPKYFIKQ